MFNYDINVTLEFPAYFNNMKKLTGSFRYTQWDPWLIIAQILSMQCILYFSLGLIVALLGTLVGDTRTLDHIFEYHVSNP